MLRHVRLSRVVAAVLGPQCANYLRRGYVITIPSENLKNESSVQIAVLVDEQSEHFFFFLSVAQFALGPQVLGHRGLSVLGRDCLHPADKVDDCDKGQKEQPEPEHYKELLIEQVYR